MGAARQILTVAEMAAADRAAIAAGTPGEVLMTRAGWSALTVTAPWISASDSSSAIEAS